ncbi:MAG: hypothetical protein K5765_06960 [Clostridia bacterium]|nr:hypothetical protein [Clostridia bacterium]
MEKVYVLVSNYVDVDSGDFNTEVIGVWENFNGANKELKKLMAQTREDFEDYDTEEEDYVDGDMTWSIWEEGEYSNHRCDLIIQCKEIQ